MKKFLMIAALPAAFGLQASDSVIASFGKVTMPQQEQLTAKKKGKKGGSVVGWYTAIGHCNVRFGPGESYGIADTIDDGTHVWVIGRVGNWYKIAANSYNGDPSDESVYYTHVQNLKRHRGPVTWG